MKLLSISKRDSTTTAYSADRKHDWYAILVLVCLQTIVWPSIAVLVIGYMLLKRGENDSLPSAALFVAAAAVSIAYVLLHSFFFWRVNYGKPKRRKPTGDEDSIDFEYHKRMRQIVARGAWAYVAVHLVGLSGILWACAAGWSVVIATRKVYCHRTRSSSSLASAFPPLPRSISLCQLHNAATGLSIGILLFTLALFSLINMTAKPFKSHAFGIFNGLRRSDSTESIDVFLEDHPINRRRAERVWPQNEELPLPPHDGHSQMRESRNPRFSFIRTTYTNRASLSRAKSMEMDPLSTLSRSMSRATLRHSNSAVSLQPESTVTTLKHSNSVTSLYSIAADDLNQDVESESARPIPLRYHRPSSTKNGQLPLVYPARNPEYRRVDHSPAQVQQSQQTVASMGIANAPSTFSAIHPPNSQQNYASGYPRAPSRTGTMLSFSQLHDMPTAPNPLFSSDVRRARTAPSESSDASLDGRQYPASWSHTPIGHHPAFSKSYTNTIPRRQASSRSTTSSRYGPTKGKRLSSHAETEEEAMTPTAAAMPGVTPGLSSIRESQVMPMQRGYMPIPVISARMQRTYADQPKGALY